MTDSRYDGLGYHLSAADRVRRSFCAYPITDLMENFSKGSSRSRRRRSGAAKGSPP
jgi:hypothetical protein